MYPLLETVTPLLNVLPKYPAMAKKEFPEAGFGVICYLYSGSDVFPGPEKDPNWALLREMRGIKYDLASGVVLSRVYEKFFNRREKPLECLLERRGSGKIFDGWNQYENNPDDYTLEFKKKLDGSMVSFIEIDKQFVPLTKKGYSEAATACYNWVKSSSLQKNYDAAVQEFYGLGPYNSATLLFEWENPERPIVIQHQKPNLVLVDIRENYTGDYLPYETVESVAKFYGIPVVERVAHGVPAKDIDAWQEIATNLPDEEGYVYSVMNARGVVLQKGKLKAKRYCEMHRANDGAYTGQRLDTIYLILQDAIDDFLPLLTPLYRDKVEKLIEIVNKNVSEFSTSVFRFCQHYRHLDQKLFALTVKNSIDPIAVGYYFKCRGANSLDEVIERVKDMVYRRLHKESELPDFEFVLGNVYDPST